MSSRFKINVLAKGAISAREHALEQAAAIELALGISLPSDLSEWPTGMVTEWNSASENGCFDKTVTIGDLARAYLAHRITRLP